MATETAGVTDSNNQPGSPLNPLRFSLLYGVCATLWIVGSGFLLTFAITDPASQWQLELVKGLVFVAVTTALLYLLLRDRADSSAARAPAAVSQPGYGIITVIVALLLCVPLVGYGILRFYSPALERQIHDDLESVGALKMAEVNLWHNERLMDLALLANSPAFITQVTKFQVEGDAGAGASLRQQLAAPLQAGEYTAVQLLGLDGQPLLALGEDVSLAADGKVLLTRTRATGRPGHGDLLIDPQANTRIDFAVPLTAPDQSDTPLGYLVLRANPEVSLLPLIDLWPGARPGTETLLIRASSQSLIILRPAAKGVGAEPLLQVPMEEAPQLAAKVLSEENPGIFEAVDYRGVPVFAKYLPVDHTGWVMVAKVDREQALKPLRDLASLISLMVFVAAVAISVMLLLLWRQQLRAYRLSLVAQTAEHHQLLRRQEQTYRETFDANPLPMWIFDSETLGFLAVNDAALAHYGYNREEFLALTIRDIRPPEDLPRLQHHLATQPPGLDQAGIWRHCKRDGTIIDVEISSHPLMFGGRQAELVLAYDISERQQALARLHESERFARATIDALALNIAVLDGSGNIIAVNKAWRLFSTDNNGEDGTTGVGANYIETTRRAASGSEDAATLLAGLEQVIHGEEDSFRFEYPCHSPTQERWFLAHITRFPGDGELRIVVAHEDITTRKVADRELHKLNHYYAALSGMNATIIRTKEPQEILDEVCRIAAYHGRLELVWVGKVEQDGRIAPVASHGRAVDYLDNVTASANPDLPESRGPGGQSVLTGTCVVSNNFDSDSNSMPWQEQARAWNLHAVAACPIKRKDGIWGNISFYAKEPGYFTPQLMNLLEELTNDLAYSLDMLDSERRRNEAESQLLLNARVMESSHEGLFITDSDNRITMANKAFCEITGYSASELIGRQPNLLKSGQQDEAFYQKLWQALLNDARWEGEIWDRRKNGEIFPAWLAITRVHDSVQDSYRHIAIYRDISEQKAYQNRIEHVASHDPLTDLPNRVLLDDRITVAIARAQRSDSQLALLFVDLDRFKLINDTLGHDIGDQLLKEIAHRIVACLRQSDTASRVGGDEFVVLLSEIASAGDAATVAEKLIHDLSRPCRIAGHELVVTASIGIATYPQDGDDAAGLTRIADVAMMAAKQAGHNRYRFYLGEMGANAGEYLYLQNQLRGAIARNELFVAYQPQIALHSGRMIGMEALLRWRHPEFGLVSPGRFIPIAEDSGQIVEIGAWVMAEACRQAQSWRASGLLAVPVSVNVSALQFRQETFVDTVTETLADSGLPAALLELEVTESLLMTNRDQAQDKLDQLHQLGVGLAIDDFGTGYSSLSYLRQFPAQRLKIDQSFIRDLPHNPDAATIARAIVSLGRSMGMSTIAEGVETEEQAEFLRSIWCEEAQGYLYAKPMARDDLEAWLAARSADTIDSSSN